MDGVERDITSFQVIDDYEDLYVIREDGLRSLS